MERYLQDFIQRANSLPSEFKQALEGLQRMDTMVQKSLDAVERKKKRHFPEFLNMSETQRRDRIHEMHLDYDRAIKTANEKVQQSGDLVKKMDRAIKYLDRQLAEYQRYLEQTPGLIRKLQQRSMNLDVAYEEEQDDYDEQYTQFATPTAKNNKRQISKDSTGPRGRSRKRAHLDEGTPVANSPQPVAPVTAQVGLEGDSELYCVCRQVSFGEMIACDDDKCPVEWYHYACVGLSAAPEGKWYCSVCTARRQKEGLPTS